MPARVALQGRIRRSIPRAQCVCFRYGNAAARTFGRARRHRPYGFVWADCTWDGDVVWEDCARMFAPTVSFGQIAHERLMPFWGLRVNDYFVCMGLCGKILRSVVGAVPVCPPVSPHKGASIVQSPRTMRVFLVWKRRYADVRAGTQAPPLRFRLSRLCMGWLVSFGQIAHGRLVSFGRIACKWLFCLCGIRGKI